MINNRKTGTRYETVASEYLESIGMTIIERNFRTPSGEIDIIARDGDYLVFVEVKYRKNAAKGYALEAIDSKKQSRIRKTALQYIYSGKLSGFTPMRFDCIGITGDKLHYVRGAF